MITYLDQAWCSAQDCLNTACARNTKYMDTEKYLQWSKDIGEPEGGPMAFAPFMTNCHEYMKEPEEIPKEPEPDVIDFTKEK